MCLKHAVTAHHAASKRHYHNWQVQYTIHKQLHYSLNILLTLSSSQAAISSKSVSLCILKQKTNTTQHVTHRIAKKLIKQNVTYISTHNQLQTIQKMQQCHTFYYSQVRESMNIVLSSPICLVANSTDPPFYPLLSTLSLLRVLTEQRCAMHTDGVPGCQLQHVPNMFILPLTRAQCLYSTSRFVSTDPSNICLYTKDLIIISDVFAPI